VTTCQLSRIHDIHLFLNRLLADGYGRITRYVFSGIFDNFQLNHRCIRFSPHKIFFLQG
jgi:hypothetical protein